MATYTTEKGERDIGVEVQHESGHHCVTKMHASAPVITTEPIMDSRDKLVGRQMSFVVGPYTYVEINISEAQAAWLARQLTARPDESDEGPF